MAVLYTQQTVITMLLWENVYTVMNKEYTNLCGRPDGSQNQAWDSTDEKMTFVEDGVGGTVQPVVAVHLENTRIRKSHTMEIPMNVMMNKDTIQVMTILMAQHRDAVMLMVY